MNAELKKRQLEVFLYGPGSSMVPAPALYAAGPPTVPAPAPYTFYGPSSRAICHQKEAGKEVEEAVKLYRSHRRIFNEVVYIN